MSRPNHCLYCLLRVDGDNYLHCRDCDKDVHIACLKRPGTPGDIVGDVFFEFHCSHCTDDGKEVFERVHLPWAMMVVMALHNLSVQSRGLSHHGFFHWRTHIACFIEKNWAYLIGSMTKKKKKWIGTISGTLSHNTPVMFLSGFNVFNEQGWWKLTHNMNPKQYMVFYNTQRSERMKQEKLASLNAIAAASAAAAAASSTTTTMVAAGAVESEVSVDDEVDVLLPAKRLRTEVIPAVALEAPVFSRTMPYMGRTPWKRKAKESSTIEADLAAFLSSNISAVDLNLDLMASGLGDSDPSNQHRHLLNHHHHSGTDSPHSGNDGSIGGGAAVTSLLPTSSDRANTVATLPVCSEWPDHLLDLDLLKTVDLMAQFEGIDNEPPDEATPTTEAATDATEASPAMFEPRVVQVTNFQTGERDYEETVSGGCGGGDIIATASIDATSQTGVVNGTVPYIKTEPLDDTSHPKATTGDLKPKTEGDDNADDGGAEEDYDTKYPVKPSLLVRNPNRHRLPWLADESTAADAAEAADALRDCDDAPAELMSAYEEAEVLHKLRHIMRSSDRRERAAIPAWVRRHYRKLCVREQKRASGKPIFDLDELLLGRRLRRVGKAGRAPAASDQVLDRYHHLVCGGSRVKEEAGVGGWRGASAIQARLAGGAEHAMFVSPHTGRVLHPFVYRNSEQMPQWVKLMSELQYTVNGVMPTRSTIDYCYVRPHHIAAVNGLLQKTFWHGIDMSECLSYPEFSIVALYKRLVVGCAFLVPDVGHNDAYISFMAVRPGWQRAGIASFMLYHLTQTCMGRDITLHVSATNAAICLYQKFGFKMEEVILDFYDKYLPIDSPHSRHAFFLRMKR